MTEKRLRSSYIRKRRYDQLATSSAIVGAAIGLMLTGAALVPSISSGETVPLASFGIGLVIIIGLAFLPYMAVRWRWRHIRSQFDD
jgi:hypothetical protein